MCRNPYKKKGDGLTLPSCVAERCRGEQRGGGRAGCAGTGRKGGEQRGAGCAGTGRKSGEQRGAGCAGTGRKSGEQRGAEGSGSCEKSGGKCGGFGGDCARAGRGTGTNLNVCLSTCGSEQHLRSFGLCICGRCECQSARADA